MRPTGGRQASGGRSGGTEKLDLRTPRQRSAVGGGGGGAVKSPAHGGADGTKKDLRRPDSRVAMAREIVVAMAPGLRSGSQAAAR